MNFLITAGGTREYIDPVRFISNASSSKMGFALANAALKAGHKVTLICANSKFEIRNSKLKVIEVTAAAEMFSAVKKHFSKCDCLIMAAAVADYTPIRTSKTKIKSGKRELTIKLKPTADILKWAGRHKNESRATSHGPRIIVGFALEDKDLRKRAEKKLKEKNLDMIIANTPAAIGANKATFHIKMRGGHSLKLSCSKAVFAKKIIGFAEQSLL